MSAFDRRAAAADREWVRRKGFAEFVRRAWHRVEPAKLVWSWGLDAICDHLEAVSRREIRDLVINVPPGSSKSTVVGVLYPAWELAMDPTRKFICASFDAGLTLRDAGRCRTLVASDWFHDRWPSVEIPTDRTASTAKSAWYTTRGGFRYSTTVRSSVTGHHAHTHIVDDPIDPRGAALASGAELDDVLTWWGQTMSTRFCDMAQAAKILIMQRLHTRDLAAEMIRKGATVLCLPMRFERSHPQRYARDPRQHDGELLNPARFPESAVRILEDALGPYGAASQLQQRPAPAGGKIFRKEWLRTFWVTLPKTGLWYITLDCAFKSTADSDLVALQAWLVDGPNLYLVDRWTERRDFKKTCDDLITFCIRWPNALAKLVEDKANGSAVISALGALVAGLLAINPDGGKEARAHAAVPAFASGNVYLPHPERAEYADGRRGATWLRGGVVDLNADAAEGSYEHVMLSFPNGPQDDDVDATTQVINHVRPAMASQLEDAMAKIFGR